ncbi:MAG TPA: Lpg1974 family pore-forming outer membrane protein [Chlamydiales bacterium]|jgi:hypothetical protein
MKIPTFLVMSAVAFSLFGDEEIALQKKPSPIHRAGKEERLMALETKVNESFTGTARGDFGAKAASARPQMSNGNIGLFVEAEALYWQQYEGGNDTAFTSVTTGPTQYLRDKELTFDWDFGFRVETGYRTPHDSWDLLARYTWMRSRGNDSVNKPTGGFVTPLYPPIQTDTSTTLVKSLQNTSLSVLDFEWNKNYFLNPHFGMKPWMGLRTGWISQTLKQKAVNYITPGTTLKVTGRNDFWGIGPWTGVETTWFVNSSWNFFHSIGGSLMVGSFDVGSKVSQNSTKLVSLKADTTRIVPMLQGSLGFGWETNFDQNQRHVAIRAAYEISHWWRQNQMLNFQTASEPLLSRFAEDLGFQGVSLQLLFDF